MPRRLPPNVTRLHPTPQQAVADALAYLSDDEAAVASIHTLFLIVVTEDGEEHTVQMTHYPSDVAGRLLRWALAFAELEDDE